MRTVTALLALLIPCTTDAQGVCFARSDYTTTVLPGDPTWVEIADIDGDGLLDLVVLNSGTTTLAYLPGIGSGEFGAVTWSTTESGTRSVALGDMTGDGELDAVITSDVASRISVHAGVGNGRFDPIGATSSPGSPQTVELADFDMDGELDVAVCHTTSKAIRVFFGDGTGALVDEVTMTAPGPIPHIALGDLDTDGDQDIVGAQVGSVFTPYVLINNQDRTFTDPGHSYLGGDPVWVALGDIDEDTIPDLVAPTDDGFGPLLTPAIGTGTGTFTKTFLLFGSASINELGDFDGDGFLDSLQELSSSPVSIQRGKGDGSFQPATPTLVDDATHLAVADLNGDELDDFVAAGGVPDGVSVMISQAGGGSFGPSLSACPVQVSLTSGGTTRFSLHPGTAHAGDVYWLVGSASGTQPGIRAAGLTLPLNFDAYMEYTLAHPNVWIDDSLGTVGFDGTSEASLTLVAGLDPNLAGLLLHHAYALLTLAPLEPIFVSNPVPLRLAL